MVNWNELYDHVAAESMTNATLLLVALLVCHYIADFCLTSPSMIRAKADGRNVRPILSHASVHALLMGLCLLLWGVLANQQRKPYWMLYGFDQLLHLLVIVGIWYYSVANSYAIIVIQQCI